MRGLTTAWAEFIHALVKLLTACGLTIDLLDPPSLSLSLFLFLSSFSGGQRREKREPSSFVKEHVIIAWSVRRETESSRRENTFGKTGDQKLLDGLREMFSDGGRYIYIYRYIGWCFIGFQCYLRSRFGVKFLRGINLSIFFFLLILLLVLFSFVLLELFFKFQFQYTDS